MTKNKDNEIIIKLSNTSMVGKVIEFYPEKECGLIKPDDNSPNIYLPLSELKKISKYSIAIGQRVKYQLGAKENVILATNIELIS